MFRVLEAPPASSEKEAITGSSFTVPSGNELSGPHAANASMGADYKALVHRQASSFLFNSLLQ